MLATWSQHPYDLTNLTTLTAPSTLSTWPTPTTPATLFPQQRFHIQQNHLTHYNWSDCQPQIESKYFLQLEPVLALTPLWVRVRIYREQSWANNIWQWSQVYAVLYCCGLQFASPDFLLYRMTSHILNKSSSMLLSIQAVSSLGLAWIGNTQLSTAPVCWTERSLFLNSAQTLKDFDLVALLNTTFC